MNDVLQAFIACINAHDVDGLGELMSDDHTFIDAHGNEVRGKEKMIAGWRPLEAAAKINSDFSICSFELNSPER